MRMLLILLNAISMPVMAQDEAAESPSPPPCSADRYRHEDGRVRQLWEASKDGQSWTTLFDGLYEKVRAN